MRIWWSYGIVLLFLVPVFFSGIYIFSITVPVWVLLSISQLLFFFPFCFNSWIQFHSTRYPLPRGSQGQCLVASVDFQAVLKLIFLFVCMFSAGKLNLRPFSHVVHSLSLSLSLSLYLSLSLHTNSSHSFTLGAVQSCMVKRK